MRDEGPVLLGGAVVAANYSPVVLAHSHLRECWMAAICCLTMLVQAHRGKYLVIPSYSHVILVILVHSRLALRFRLAESLLDYGL